MTLRDKIATLVPCLPIILLVEHGLAFLTFKEYPVIFNEYGIITEHIFSASGIMLIMFYADSKDWSFFSKRSLLFLFVVWVSNLIMFISNAFFPDATLIFRDMYFGWYLLSLWAAFFGILIWSLCNR